MKLRKPLPLLLFLAPALASAHLQRRSPADALTNDQILALNHGAQARTPEEAQKNAQLAGETKPYKGTEDAPVDGMDGKPHAGPFVDTTPEDTEAAKAVPTSLKNFGDETVDSEGWRIEDIPEKNDGVMNDEGRPVPRKGTTGTEGGVTEKEKERLMKGNAENKPKSPEEAPPLPHSEQKRIEADQEKHGEKSGARKDAADEQGEGAKKKGGEYGDGGYGMEKPEDLPEKPHNIPYTDTRSPVVTEREDGPPVSGGRDSWLKETLPYTEGEKPKPSIPQPDGSLAPAEDEGYMEWFHSFVLSLTMILFSEIGDKTFLVAALMAMRHPRLQVFSAAFGALIVMTVLSAVLGHAVPTLLPKKFTAFAAAILFLVFGAKMLHEGLAMDKDAGVGEEMREVEAELEEKEHEMERHGSHHHHHHHEDPYSLEAGRGRRSHSIKRPNGGGDPSPPSSPGSRSPSPSKGGLGGLMNLAGLIMSPAWVQTFVMTFLGEWGDRSQIATIAMAAGQDYWLVTLGAITGHAVCTGVAVLGGRALAGKVSMRVVTIGGALAFLAFGLIYLVECMYD
ncbi:hypothetical protein MBLNU230_g2045t1 [Neophaeotheca triangularis]